jgi:hypothetical protein
MKTPTNKQANKQTNKQTNKQKTPDDFFNNNNQNWHFDEEEKNLIRYECESFFHPQIFDKCVSCKYWRAARKEKNKKKNPPTTILIKTTTNSFSLQQKTP